jgi:capsular polysaccharide biosynthesis protein
MEDIAQVILRRLRLVLLVVLVFLGSTLGVTFWQTPMYEASARLLVGVVEERKKPGPPQEYELLAQNVEGLQQMVPEVIEAIPTRPVAEEVIQRLGLRMESAELLENLRVEEDPGTMFISLSYKDTDPERAQRIANTVAEVASEKIRPEVRFGPFEYPFESHLGIHVWERASVPTTPVSPDPLRNGLLALVLGLAAGIGLALLMERRAT